jgi:hypothetical protein
MARQFATGYKIFNGEWDGRKSMIMNGSDDSRNQILTRIRDGIRRDIERLNHIINDFDKRDTSYSSDDDRRVSAHIAGAHAVQLHAARD